MRPSAIVIFERLFLLSIVISTVQLALQANEQVGVVGSPMGAIVLGAVVILFSVALVLLASRRRSNVARWVLAVLTGIGVAVTLYDVISGAQLGLTGLLGLLAIGLQVAAVAMLFSPGGAGWFRRAAGREVSAE